jgi:hypothetical protein
MSTKRKKAQREHLPVGIERRGGVLVAVSSVDVAPGKTPSSSAGLLDVRRWKRELDASASGLDHAVVMARRAGASWAELADALGVSPQAVHRKYRERAE